MYHWGWIFQPCFCLSPACELTTAVSVREPYFHPQGKRYGVWVDEPWDTPGQRRDILHQCLRQAPMVPTGRGKKDGGNLMDLKRFEGIWFSTRFEAKEAWPSAQPSCDRSSWRSDGPPCLRHKEEGSSAGPDANAERRKWSKKYIFLINKSKWIKQIRKNKKEK